ncbi:MAG: L-threonylcarbamoyladenylate synthase [Acidiferrobacteraceae bacterium]
MSADARKIRRAARVARRGGLIAYPTESCFGLGCIPGARGAVLRLLRIKRRPRHKGLILIADSAGRLCRYARVPPEAARSWPGPYTWLVEPGRHARHWVRGGHPRIAVRVPGHAAARALSLGARDALVSTSANRSGERPARTAREVHRRFGGLLDMVVDGRVGNRRSPSRIVDAVTGAVVRDG